LSGYVDIHAHVLPGIDDGPAELDGALEMLRTAAGCGISTIVATPHVRSDFPDVHVPELAGRCQALRDRIAGEDLGLELVCGAEVSLVWAVDASDEQLRLVTYGQRGTDVLIETPLAATAGLDTLLYELRVRGLRVTLAHPERSRELQRGPSPLAELVTRGILLQVNADSVLGNGRRSATAKLGIALCRDGLAHALASDAHRAESWRPVSRLVEAVEAVAALVGPDRAHWMASDAPAAILAGTELPEAPPVISSHRRRWPWSRR
jgi:protein-tyrosine phosphatase